ncbi:hypothetical protein KEM56_004123 [Ascosphaera pollenicola]|nr:hypothetical protein KEM56_004123 [Ascosphaera pollenicola]
MAITFDDNAKSPSSSQHPRSSTLAPPHNPFSPSPANDEYENSDIENNAGSPHNDDFTTSSKAPRATRWATQRIGAHHGHKKRVSILDRIGRKGHLRSMSGHHSTTGGTEEGDTPGMERDEKRKSSWSKRRHSNYNNDNDPNVGGHYNDVEGPLTAKEDEAASAKGRTIYFNQALPPEMLDEEGQLKITYARNKIRTAKYTPLSFIPKNLYFQFHNVANIYFLFVIILNFFPIFGATNPGLNAVPLIAILAITAIKDGIEDWRRTVLDNELNNSPVHRLQEWDNVNSSVDNVGPWRRFKKACTRGIIRSYRWMKAMATKKGRQEREERKEKERERAARGRSSIEYDPRVSIATHRASIADFDPAATRGRSQSFVAMGQAKPSLSNDEVTEGGAAMEMTPVPSPNPEAKQKFSSSQYLTPEHALHRDSTGDSSLASTTASRDYGSLINPNITGPNRARFARDSWKNVQVGDFVRIYCDEQVPADIVILATSDPDGGCYVETKNLDGETNLKVRQALRCGAHVRHARDCEKAEFVIESEAPHANLYAYNGAIKWNQYDRDGSTRPMVEPITINNLVLRGCCLRNTEWILGVAVFTGLETKIMLNSGETPRKRPYLARSLNWNVMYNFILLFAMCLISGIVQGVTWAKGRNTMNYFEFGMNGGTPAVSGVVTFWAALILFQNLVPISLYITLEIVRTIQAIFIYSDTYMYYDKLEYPCTPKSWNISDDLGQIEYIFSDKTGTLTQNVMEFKKCTINSVAYGEAYTEAQAGLQRREGIDVELVSAQQKEIISRNKEEMLVRLRQIHDNPYLHDEDITFVSKDFVMDLQGAKGPEQAAAVEHFMLAIALCHTVVTEREPGDPPRIEFKAQSPDEAALVATARDCGFTVLGRSGDDIRVNVMGQDRKYRILNILEFNSSRKRMSAIVRMPDNRIILFCKGADSIIYGRLARGMDMEIRKNTAQHLEHFAREGLRTLCIAQRVLSEEEYAVWNKKHDEAAAALTDRDLKLEEVSSEIEQELRLIGGTAIEDRLQDGVPDTIQLLSNAGIKLWVLTGDKVETAINIGFSCNLLNNDMELIVLNVDVPAPAPVKVKGSGGSIEDSILSDTPAQEKAADAEAMKQAEELLMRHLNTFGLVGSDEELIAARLNHEPAPPTHAVVVDGDTLKLLLRPELQQRFLLLCKQCKAVLCCRVSPAQKAAVVAMVKNGLDVMALSIGDGANDVAMIQEADVGVGIVGEEGRQAAMSSDYAIGQFRFLQRLILVHGRWDYRRMSECTANFFYKNLVWTFALFWYSIYNNFDCSYLFDYTYIVLVNLAFTSLPVICMGILDQDVDDKVSLAVPQLYKRGIERLEWSQTKFWLYMLDGFYQSVICFFTAYLAFYKATPLTENGLDISDRMRMGVFVACFAVLVSDVYVLLNTYRWDWLTVLIDTISILLFWTWTGIYTSFTSSGQFYKAGSEVFGTAVFWALMFLTSVVCLAPRFAIKSVHKIYWPLDVDIIREQIRLGRFRFLDNYDAYVPPSAGLRATNPFSYMPRGPPMTGGDGKPNPATSSSVSSSFSSKPVHELPKGTLEQGNLSSNHNDANEQRHHLTQPSPFADPPTATDSGFSFSTEDERRPFYTSNPMTAQATPPIAVTPTSPVSRPSAAHRHTRSEHGSDGTTRTEGYDSSLINLETGATKPQQPKDITAH